MNWSWKLGSFAGIGVYVHPTFLLLLGWVAYSHWNDAGSIEGALGGVGFMLAIFFCVVLHEFGHALTARRFGIKTRDITLYPIGGVARLERIPDQPIQELLVALAGPAVNVVIALALYGFLAVQSGWKPIGELGVSTGPFAQRLLLVNASLVVFNLLPAFPMDGGRVLRALLATRMEYARATQIAAGVGQAMAFVLGFAGMLHNPFLVLVAFFVWFGATNEAAMAQMKAALGGIPVSRAMLTEFATIGPEAPVSEVVQRILSGSQHDFPVIAGSRVVGILTRDAVFRALAERGDALPAAAVMDTEFESLDAREMLEPAFLRLQGSGLRTVPVLQHGELVGLLTADNVGEFLMIQSARSKRGSTQRPAAGA